MSSRLASVPAVALLAFGLAAAPASASLKNCPMSLKEQQHLGAEYVTSLKVKGATCARGKDVVRQYNRCRKQRGGVAGRCPKSHAIDGYHCTEVRNSIATQFDAKATCRKGTRRIIFTYFQHT
jgi:hypothetical protein